ncbi:MAG: sulfotransferase domain-containing protein [Nocardioidaceae bacterium]
MTRHLLVIGGQRCGTTYLSSLLDAHPQIAMARPARPEPKVFSSDELTGRGLDWYEHAFFAHATTELVLGEKSTSYIEDPAAAGRAAATLGKADIFVLMRDPVLRAVSNWRFSTDNGLEQRPLGQALVDNLEGAAAWNPGTTSVSPFAYLERGRFADFLPPWLAAFPSSVHLWFLADMVSDAGAVAQMYDSMGVDPAFRPPGFGQPVNESSEPMPDLSPMVMTRLRDYFRDSDDELARLTGRPLPWSI